jgi:hypothetical protein
MSAFLDIY